MSTQQTKIESLIAALRGVFLAHGVTAAWNVALGPWPDDFVLEFTKSPTGCAQWEVPAPAIVQHTNTPQYLIDLARELVAAADVYGLVVTIERAPGLPLAMGHAHSVIEFWPKRKAQNTVTICEGLAMRNDSDKISAQDFHEKVSTPGKGVAIVPMDGRKIALLLDNR